MKLNQELGTGSADLNMKRASNKSNVSLRVIKTLAAEKV
jgi:hypothetical protein